MYESILQRLEQRFQGKDFLTIEDLCQFLGCSPETVYNWGKRAAGRRPPKLRVGNFVKYPLEPMAQWLAEELRRGRG